MKKETPTQVSSSALCEIFINFSSERLLLSMKLKIAYIVEGMLISGKYNSTLKKKDFSWLNLVQW